MIIYDTIKKEAIAILKSGEACAAPEHIKQFNGTLEEFKTTFPDYSTDNIIEDFVPPIEMISVWRLRAILSIIGKIDAVELALKGLPEPTKTVANMVWNFGQDIMRNGQTVQLIQQVLGLTDSEVDDIFQQANDIQI